MPPSSLGFKHVFVVPRFVDLQFRIKGYLILVLVYTFEEKREWRINKIIGLNPLMKFDLLGVSGPVLIKIAFCITATAGTDFVSKILLT